jgi:hypothetical protein
LKKDIELSREALKAFNCDNIDGLTVTIGGVSPDEKKASLYMGTPESIQENRRLEVGQLDTTGNITHFNIGAEKYRLINLQEGYEVSKNFIDYYVSYTSIPDFTEITFIDKDHKISIAYYKSESNQKIEFKTIFYGELKNERNFELEMSEDSIYYNYYECDHDQHNSSGPTWYFTVDTIRNKYSNWGVKGEKEYGTYCDLELKEAQKKVLEQLKKSNLISDISKLKEISRIKEYSDIIKLIYELEQMNLKKRGI